MSQQGGRPTGPEDDWWGQLYDDSTADTGPAPTADSLDDRFASAAGTVRPTGPANQVPPPRTPTEQAVADAQTDWWLAPDAATAPTPSSTGSVPSSSDGSVASSSTGSVASSSDGSVPSSSTRSAPSSSAGAAPSPDAGAGQIPDPGAGPTPDVGAGPTPDALSASRSMPPPPDLPPAPMALPPGPPPPGFTHPSPAARSTGTPPPPSVGTPTTSTSGLVARTPTAVDLPLMPDELTAYVGSRPPTYDAEPTALPTADPDALDDLVADTVLDGAFYGNCALRAVSVRGDSARYRGEPRRDALLVARFGTGEHALVLVAMATGARATPGAHRAAAEACRWIGRAVGRSHVRLAQDMRAARRGDLKSGLHRLTDRSLGRLRAAAAEQGLEPDAYTATLRCLLLPADPECRTRVFFGVGDGGLFRLRGGEWQDLEPGVGEVAGEPVVGFGALPAETPEGDRLTMDLGIPTPPSPYDPPPEPPRDPFRFRASVARPGDTLLMCTSGLADPLRGEPALPAHLTERWSRQPPPGLAAFLADTQVRVKGYADDRTAAAVWEA
ncbi:PP2C family serine/threonine-protein phosphatase [Streptomyces sp. YKOK-I1]